MSHKTGNAFIFWISRLPRGLKISSWTFFNSPFHVDFKNIRDFIICLKLDQDIVKILQGTLLKSWHFLFSNESSAWALWITHQHSWALLRVHEHSWALMSTHEHSWVLMSSHEHSEALMSNQEHSWALISIHDDGAMAPWALMSSPGTMLLNAHEYSQEAMSTHFYSWLLMTTQELLSAHESSGVLLSAHECSWSLRTANEWLWVVMSASEWSRVLEGLIQSWAKMLTFQMISL